MYSYVDVYLSPHIVMCNNCNLALVLKRGHPLSATSPQMERTALATILIIPGFAQSIGIFLGNAEGEQSWVLLMSTACRELRELFRLWRWAIVDQAIVHIQALEADAWRRGH